MSDQLALPTYVAIAPDNNRPYFRYVAAAGDVHGFLQSSENEILKSPFTKFKLEYPKSRGPSQLVHIKCCYNNKYLMRSSETGTWIVGTATGPEEDKSKWSCTLFEFEFDTSRGNYKVRHVQSGYFILISSYQGYSNCMGLNASGYFPIKLVDMSTFVTLPKYIAFKGDNDKYLCAHWLQSHEYNEFMADDMGIKEARYEVIPLYDGRVRVKSLYWNKFWRRSPNWIWADSTDTTANNKDTLFLPYHLSGNVVALKNLGNDKFCTRVSKEWKSDCLEAASDDMIKETQFQVTDAVLRREIYNVTYQLTDARIYDLTTVDSLTKEVTNGGTESTEGSVSFSYTETKSKTWNKSNSWSIGASVEISSGVPLIGEVGIKIETSYSQDYSWGENDETSKTVSTNQKVVTPPMTRSVVTMLVQKGTLDIPFTYTQRSLLYDGTMKSLEKLMGFLLVLILMSTMIFLTSLSRRMKYRD